MGVEVPVLGPLYFALKAIVVVFVIMWIRGTWPRFRIDQMLGWPGSFGAGVVGQLAVVAVVLKLPVPGLVQWVLALAEMWPCWLAR